MSIFLRDQWIHTISIKMPAQFFIDVDKVILKGTRIASTILKKKKLEELHYPILGLTKKLK